MTELMSVRRIIHRDPLRLCTILPLNRGFFFLFLSFFLGKTRLKLIVELSMIFASFEDWGASRTQLSGFLCNLGVADELNTLTSSFSSFRFSNALVTILMTCRTSSIFFSAGTSGL